MRLHDKGIDDALAAFNLSINNPQFIECKRCGGNGYHHGFGEDGHDPDWCLDCGGAGYDIVPGEERRAMVAAISTYLAAAFAPSDEEGA